METSASRTTYRVHEFADLAGVTVKALHHYDRLGLLKPSRTAAGYRVYANGDLERLEQIVALKFLGLPLKQIKALLARDGAVPLRTTLQRQRAVLEDSHRRLERAVRAVRDAEQALQADPSSTTVALQRLIKVITMQDGIDLMRKYYSDEAWEDVKGHFEDWPPPAFRLLYHDINAAIDLAPTSTTAQALATRWMEMTQRAITTPAVRTGTMKAWADRARWPVVLKQRMEALGVERALRFVTAALWARWDAERAEMEARGDVVPRVSQARRALFKEGAALIGADPDGREAQALLGRWRLLLEEETGGDDETKAELLAAWKGRREWPAGMTSWVAALYETNADTWRRVTDIIEAAGEHAAAAQR